jgi:hypothetical protein
MILGTIKHTRAWDCLLRKQQFENIFPSVRFCLISLRFLLAPKFFKNLGGDTVNMFGVSEFANIALHQMLVHRILVFEQCFTSLARVYSMVSVQMAPIVLSKELVMVRGSSLDSSYGILWG